jgi:thioredoxin 1
MIPMPRSTALALIASLAACASAPQATTQEPASPAAAPAPGQPAQDPEDSGEQFQIANASGELIPVEQVLVPGKITVVDFYAEWCAPCKVLEKQLRAEIDGEARIAVRKIDVTTGEAEAVIAAYGVRNLPHVRIYGPDGKLLHDLPGTQAEQTGRLARDALTSL